jgi:hypothetical protein
MPMGLSAALFGDQKDQNHQYGQMIHKTFCKRYHKATTTEDVIETNVYIFRDYHKHYFTAGNE